MGACLLRADLTGLPVEQVVARWLKAVVQMQEGVVNKFFVQYFMVYFRTIEHIYIVLRLQSGGICTQQCM